MGNSELFKITVPASDLSNADFKAVRSFHISSSVGTHGQISQSLPQFTSYDEANGKVSFIVSGSSTFLSVDNSEQRVLGIGFTKQPTESDRGDFEDTAGNATADTLAIPEVDLQLKSQAIVAKTRKLKAVWTPELAQDLNAYHSVDAEAELTSMLSEYISMEIDLEILDMLIQDAVTQD